LPVRTCCITVPFKDNLEGINAMLGARLASLPDVPTIAELGFPGYETSSWRGPLAPADTPREVVAKINAEAVAMLNAPEVRQRIPKKVPTRSVARPTNLPRG
jgi:tripartite-type tricarboxylate transporter receptor subunit TctC